MRIGPAPCDQPAVPRQQGLRPHREGVPGTARQHPAKRCQQQTVVWLKPRPLDLAAKDRELVAEHENLQILLAVSATDQDDQLEQTADNEVEGRQKQRRPPADETLTLPPSHLVRSSICTPRDEPAAGNRERFARADRV